MWIPKIDLITIGVREATIYRKDKSGKWESRRSAPDGRGQPPKEYLLESLPIEIQIRWAKMDAERRASAAGDKSNVESQTSSDLSPDGRLHLLQAALARFSPPQYTLEQRNAVENRCIQLSKLSDEVISLITRLKRSGDFTVKMPGSTEAGLDRAYHPDLARLARQAASADPIYLALYPSSKNPPSVRTLLRMIQAYKKEGPVAFIRTGQTLSPAADDRFLEVPQIAVDWLQSNLKSYVKTSITVFGEKWLAWARKHNVKLPFAEHRPGISGTCYTWLYRWRQRVPAVTMTLATKGERGFEATYAYIVRDYSDLRPRDGFTMDWKIFDVECWLPARKAGGKPALVRLWVCPVFDLASRACFGFHIADRPSARGVTLAYLNGIGDSEWKSEPGLEMLRGMQRSRAGMEAFVHWDNGKDYRSRSVKGHEVKIERFDLETGLVAVLETYKIGLAAEVGIKVRHAKPYNAKAKIVERWFNTVGKWEQGLPGYKGDRSEHKPHYYPAACRIHDAFCKGRPPKPEDVRQLPPLWREVYERNKAEYGFGTPFLSESELKSEWVKFLLDDLRKPHSSLANARGKMSPIEYLKLNADSPHMLTEQSMAALLMEPRILTVRRGQLEVQWGGEKFVYREVSSDLSDGAAMYRLPDKTQVEFRYDPNNLGRALVITGGASLCWVEQPELLGWNASQADFQQANAKKKLARNVAKEYFNTRLDRPDWREEASERQEFVEMKAVVGGEDMPMITASDEGDQSPGAQVIVPTRFDRKSADAPGGKKGSVLSLVNNAGHSNADDFIEPWEAITGSTETEQDDGWKEPWEE